MKVKMKSSQEKEGNKNTKQERNGEDRKNEIEEK
jgi:hypothetical protein